MVKLKGEQIDKIEEEKVIGYCYNEEATWVHNIKDVALGQKLYADTRIMPCIN